MRIGTRSSTMALAQTTAIAKAFEAAHPARDVETVRFSPMGDVDQTSKLDRHGGKGGAFVAEIRDAIRDGRLDCAMHSLKDMPGDEETPGLVIGAYMPREAVEDALVLRPGLSLEALSDGGAGVKIGTNAVRRAAYLQRHYPNAEIIHFRGAADTRIRKLDAGSLQKLPDGGEVGPADALVMAACGLERVGFGERIAYRFTHREILPAIGQGIVAVECRANDWTMREALSRIDCEASRIQAMVERELLWVLNGHCNTPIAGHAVINGETIEFIAAVTSESGDKILEQTATGPVSRPRELGRQVALALLQDGAAALIDATRP